MCICVLKLLLEKQGKGNTGCEEFLEYMKGKGCILMIILTKTR